MPSNRTTVIPAPIHLLDLQINTLFHCDPGGRLRSIAEVGYPEAELPPAPRFFMGRTRQGNRWRFRHDLPAALVRSLQALCRREPVTPDFSDPPQQAQAIRRLLGEHAPVEGEERGPAYWIPAGEIPAPVDAGAAGVGGVSADSAPRLGAARVVRITAGNAHLLQAHFPYFLKPPLAYESGPLMAVAAPGDAGEQAVAVCHCARLNPRAAEAGVETAPAYRGQGHAGRAVAAWAAAIYRLGLYPLYSTGWENTASQAVARKLGMQLYAEDWLVG